VLKRIQNNAMKLNTDARVQPFGIAEVFRGFTDSVWSDPVNGKKQVELSVVRRNLQRDYIKRLSALVLGQTTVPADARSLARMHLKEIDGRVLKLLNNKDISVDDTSRAHLEESRERITKVLTASMQASD
jgi:hypothetical protein